jgi:hypothetical protein
LAARPLRLVLREGASGTIHWSVRGCQKGPVRTIYSWSPNMGSVVGIATAYGLDGPGDRIPMGQDFPHLSRPTLRPTQPQYNGYRVFSGCKVRPGRDADTSPPSSAEIKNRVELHLYSP